ncbi:patatin-like phospholipase family protein [Marinobacteraceae bacterium S3BR75-40.1]
MRQRKALQTKLSRATRYEEWLAAAEGLDELDGLLDWRAEPGTDLFHESLLRRHLNQLRHFRQEGNAEQLIDLLQESLYRHLGELSNPALYSVARSGTKYVIREFLDEVELSMIFICDHPVRHIDTEKKLQLFREAEQVYGRPALMLSGGAAFGIYHLGVTKALWENGLLPDTIAGSSMGTIVAAAICSRNEQELAEFFGHPERIHRDALRWMAPSRMWNLRCAMDQDQLLEHILTNIGSATFRDAYAHSGRSLNVSVSPTRIRQKPRLLNYLTAPDVLIEYAALASCAIPGIYQPVTLKSRQHNKVRPYLPTERWIDGSVHGDMPLMRMARLQNVNQTIVSQANPHVLPFITHYHRRGRPRMFRRAVASFIHANLAEGLEVARDLASSSRVHPVLEQAHALSRQEYTGDMTIRFPFDPLRYRKVVSNPTLDDLLQYIRLGEQATWPRIAMIHDRTRISRVFKECIHRLKVEAGRYRYRSDSAKAG